MLADNAVTTAKILDANVTTSKIADANVTPIKIEPGLANQVLVTDALGAVAWINKDAFGAIADQVSIEGLGTTASPFKVKNLGIVTGMLADGAVTNIKLGADAVTTDKILDGEVQTGDIADLNVTTIKLADNAVTTAKILDANVTTSKIADANVTPIKIEPGLANQVLVTDALGAVAWINKDAFGAIADQVSIEGLGTTASPFKVKNLGIVTGMLADNAVTTAKILDANVTTSKIADANVTPIKIEPGLANQVLVTDALGAVAWINNCLL